MHIPDGYLSPQTCGVLGAASAVAAAVSTYKTAKTVKAKHIPLLSIGAAFSFIIMMFNIPVPDGTTAHAVGGALLGILLGPWAAFVSVTIALVIQAIFFGDGGILALGANIFNMAFVLPFSAYYVYQLIAGQSEITSKRRYIAAGIAGFIGINLAALFTAVEFGLQPYLFHAADGTPLYSPYGLGVAIPAMAFAHILIAGPVEGVVTGLVVSYFQKTNPAMLNVMSSAHIDAEPKWKKFIPAFVIMVILSPLGLLAQGTAWGEWGADEVKAKLGFVPAGMEKFGDFWKHIFLPDYSLKGFDQSFWQQAAGYIIAAIVGLLLVTLIGYVIGKFVAKGANPSGNTELVARK